MQVAQEAALKVITVILQINITIRDKIRRASVDPLDKTKRAASLNHQVVALVKEAKIEAVSLNHQGLGSDLAWASSVKEAQAHWVVILKSSVKSSLKALTRTNKTSRKIIREIFPESVMTIARVVPLTRNGALIKTEDHRHSNGTKIRTKNLTLAAPTLNKNTEESIKT